MTIVCTADQVCIIDGLRVWILSDAEPGLPAWTLPYEPGTVDLTSAPGPPDSDSAVRIDLDSGRSVIVPAQTLTACHPRTGQLPPYLGTCRWIGTCTEPAVRMVPHSLMSPVPACRTCRPYAPGHAGPADFRGSTRRRGMSH